MPTNYDKFNGAEPNAFKNAWQMAGNVSVRYPGLEKNSSFYPWFGHSHDVRWILDYHIENASSYYGTQTQFWQPRIATGVKYKHHCSKRRYSHDEIHENNNTYPPMWPFGAVVHVIHYNWWGNWQWEISHTNKGKVTPQHCQSTTLDDETVLTF